MLNLSIPEHVEPLRNQVLAFIEANTDRAV